MLRHARLAAAAPEDDGDGISGGAIAGIVVGILAGLLLCAGCVYALTRRYQAQPSYPTRSVAEPFVPPQPQPQPTGDIVTVQEPPPPAPIPVMPYAIPYPLVPAPPPINQYVVDGQYLVGSQPPMMMVDQPYQPYAGGSVAPMGMMPGMSVPPMMPGMSVPPMPPAMMPYSPPSVFGTQQYQLAV